MRIRGFKIESYGPIKDFEATSLPLFTLFFGKNESGKTLTIDALLKMMLGKKLRREFEDINRVEMYPRGWVELEVGGELLELPKDRDLSELSGISAAEYRNVFIIRNSDLFFAEEKSFYNQISERLMGSQTKQMENLEQAIRRLCKLTDTKIEFSNREEDWYLKTRIERAKELLAEIEELEVKMADKGLDVLEVELDQKRDQLSALKVRLESLERMDKKRRYLTVKEAIEGEKREREKLKELEKFSEDEERRWYEAEQRIREAEINKFKELEVLNEIEAKVEELDKKVLEKEDEIRKEEEKMRKIEELKPQMIIFKSEEEKKPSLEKRKKLWKIWVVIWEIILIFSLIGMIYKISMFWAVAGTISALGMGISLWQYAKIGKSLQRMVENWHKLKEESEKKLGISAVDLKDLMEKVEQKKREFDAFQSELKELSIKKELEKKQKSQQEQRISNLTQEIKRQEELISQIKTRSGINSYKEYKKGCEERREVDTRLDKYSEILKSHLGNEPQFWEEKAKELEMYKNAEEEGSYDEREYKKVRERISVLEEEIKKKDKELKELEAKYHEIARDANELKMGDEYLYCESNADLKRIKKRIRGFISDNERAKDNAQKAIEILNQLAKEGKERIGTLFEKNGEINRYFRAITGEMYEEVSYKVNGKEHLIKVKSKDGEELEAGKLSGGTVDQLYFAIRAGLARKLLKEEKGFFILDDPFLKSDKDRLKNQMEILKQLLEEGWQILYFTAKEEVREMVGTEIARRGDEKVKVVDMEKKVV